MITTGPGDSAAVTQLDPLIPLLGHVEPTFPKGHVFIHRAPKKVTKGIARLFFFACFFH